MEARECPSCGHRTEGDANFCSRCGARLDGDEATVTLVGLEASETPTADLGELPELRSGQALVVVVRGPNQGSRYFVDSPVTTIGRHPDSDIHLDDVTVSRRHAELRRDEAGGFAIRDVGSLNGTYIRRGREDPVRVEESVLHDGDEIQVGRYRMVFVSSEGRSQGTGRPAG